MKRLRAVFDQEKMSKYGPRNRVTLCSNPNWTKHNYWHFLANTYFLTIQRLISGGRGSSGFRVVTDKESEDPGAEVVGGGDANILDLAS